jgi:hypothetical protein
LANANDQFAKACAKVAARHVAEPEMQAGLTLLGRFSSEFNAALKPFITQYGRRSTSEPEQLAEVLLAPTRAGEFGALRDLHALFVMAVEIHMSLTILIQAAQALRDQQLLTTCLDFGKNNKRQRSWITTEIKHRSAQALTVPCH